MSLLLAMVGLFMIIPTIWSFYYDEPDAIPFLVSMVSTVLLGGSIWILTRIKRAVPTLREAMLIVTLGWVVASLYSAIPYMLAGTFTNFVDAYFESVSGYTATGSSVITNIEAQNHGILMWRGLTQWLGGMGIVLFFVAVLPQLGVSASYLVQAEAGPGPEAPGLTQRIRKSVLTLWWIYLGMTLLEIALLLACGLPLFDSMTVTFGTVATGGYCAKNLSIASYNSVSVEIVVIIFMIAASVNFSLYYILFWKRSWRNFIRNRELRLYAIILVIGCAIITLDLVLNLGYGVGRALRLASFQTASIQSTTGFSTADFDQWSAISKFVLLILMLIGGCSGSTSGAIKLVRVAIIGKYINRQTRVVHSPHIVMPLKFSGEPVNERWTMRVLGFVVLYLVSVLLFTLLMTATGLDIVSSLSGVIATMGTVGPGLNVVGPASNYASLSSIGKVILTFPMILGRLEFFPVLAIFTPAFWKWR